MSKVKRERLFIELLESVDKEDAKLLLSLKDGKMPYKTITYRLIDSAFPGILPPFSTKKEDEQEENLQA